MNVTFILEPFDGGYIFRLPPLVRDDERAAVEALMPLASRIYHALTR